MASISSIEKPLIAFKELAQSTTNSNEHASRSFIIVDFVV